MNAKNPNRITQQKIQYQITNEADKDFIPYLEMILENRGPEMTIQQTSELIETARAGKEAEIALDHLRSSGALSETVHSSLLRTIRAGKNAIDSLIEIRLGIVAHLAILHQGRGVALEDLFQEGCIKLTETVHDLIDNTEVTDPQQLYRIMYGRVKYHLHSLVKEAEKAESLCCNDADLAHRAVLFVEDGFAATENDNRTLSIALEDVLTTLTPREEKVVKMYYGIGQYPRCKSFDQVSKHFDVDRERIRQIHKRALRKLRHPSRANHLRVYLEELG